MSSPEGVDLVRESGGVLALNVGGAGLSFVIQLLLARGLGAEQFGLYVLVMSWVFFLVLVSRLGLDALLLRFAAAYRTVGEFGYLRGLIKWVCGVVLGVSSLCAAALLAGVGVLVGSTAAALPCFVVGAALVPLLAILHTNKSILLALGHPVLALVPDQIVRPSLLIVTVVVAGYALGIRLSAAFVMALATGSTLLALAIGIGWLFARLPIQARTFRGQYRVSEWLGVSLSLGVVTVAESVAARSDVMILGFYRAGGDVGVYGAALAVASVLEFLVGAVTFVLAPRFAQPHAHDQPAQVQRLLTRSVVVLLAATVPVAAAIVLFGGDILAIFGKDFTGGHGVLQLIVASQLVVPFTGPMGLVLSMTGHHRSFAVATVVTALANLLLLLVLVSAYGTIGAAAARVGAAVIRGAVLGTIAWLRIGVMPTPFASLLVGRLRGERAS